MATRSSVLMKEFNAEEQAVILAHMIRLRFVTSLWLTEAGNIADDKQLINKEAKLWFNRCREWIYKLETQMNSVVLNDGISEAILDSVIEIDHKVKKHEDFIAYGYANILLKKGITKANKIARMVMVSEVLNITAMMNGYEIFQCGGRLDFLACYGGTQTRLPLTMPKDMPMKKTALAFFNHLSEKMCICMAKNAGMNLRDEFDTNPEIERTLEICGPKIMDELLVERVVRIYDAIAKETLDEEEIQRTGDRIDREIAYKKRRTAEYKEQLEKRSEKKVNATTVNAIKESFEHYANATIIAELPHNPVMDAFYSMEISRFDFPKKAKKLLPQNGIKTIGDILIAGSTITDIVGIGPKTYKGIKETFAKIGVNVRDTDGNIIGKINNTINSIIK